MIQFTSTAPDLGLRPIPGPDPVEMPTYDWWLWLIPLVLIGFLCYWWSRKAIKRESTSQDGLYLALEQADDTDIDTRVRYQQLHHALREYLADTDPAWKTLTADDSLPAWQKLFPNNAELAKQWHIQWLVSEAIFFSPDPIMENQVTDYTRLINELEMKLSGNYEKALKP
jgi:hypothetical protein